MRPILSRTAAVLLATTLLGSGPAFSQATGSGGQPAVTAKANAPNQTPAFENQTRAPQPAELIEVETDVVADGLPKLWAIEFMPDGRILATAKAGQMLILSPDGESRIEVSGVPEVDARGQGGLLDVVLSPDFASDDRIYFSFSEPREGGGNGTSVASARLSVNGDAASLEDVKVIFQQKPAYKGNKHFGSRLVFADDGTLFVTVGERSDTPIRNQAQDIDSGLGKVFRINPDGSVPQDNPFVGQNVAQPEIWSYGHRNLQAAALDGEGRLWTIEHGPRGGDELNHPEAGKNYGWPIITYGIDYDGTPIGDGLTKKDGMEQPVYFWDPVIGPSGMAIYQGDEFPEWKGAVLAGGLVSQGLVVLKLDGGRVASEERIPLDARIRDVKVGPDGAVYVITETRGASGKSSILRLTKSG